MTCSCLDLGTLGFWPIMPKNLLQALSNSQCGAYGRFVHVVSRYGAYKYLSHVWKTYVKNEHQIAIKYLTFLVLNKHKLHNRQMHVLPLWKPPYTETVVNYLA